MKGPANTYGAKPMMILYRYKDEDFGMFHLVIQDIVVQKGLFSCLRQFVFCIVNHLEEVT